MTVTGWQAVAILAIAGALAVVAALVPNQGAVQGLLSLATVLATGVFTLLQPRRIPPSGSRASDRSSTAAGGVQITPPPETLPPRR